MAKATYTVGYRMGGTERFEWKRTVPFPTSEEANNAAAEIAQGGRLAYVYTTSLLDSIGLPETYDPTGTGYFDVD
jgi:hypothetical protein